MRMLLPSLFVLEAIAHSMVFADAMATLPEA